MLASDQANVTVCSKWKGEKKRVWSNGSVSNASTTQLSQKPKEWPKWIRRFDRFRIACGLELTLQPNEKQVNTLIYAMGDEAQDVITSLCLMEEETSEYNTVIAKLEAHFVVRKNVI